MPRTSNDVQAYIEPIATAIGLELVEVEVKGPAKRPFVRVLIYKEGGVSAEDCRRLAGQLRSRWNEEDYFFPGQHRLEVASPGLDRPLKIPRDFARNLGQKVRLFLAEPHEGRKELVGRIERVGKSHLTLLPEGKQAPLDLALGKINRGKLVIEF